MSYHVLDENYLYGVFKRGDKEIAAVKHPNEKIYDGMLTQVIDPQEQGIAHTIITTNKAYTKTVKDDEGVAHEVIVPEKRVVQTIRKKDVTDKKLVDKIDDKLGEDDNTVYTLPKEVDTKEKKVEVFNGFVLGKQMQEAYFISKFKRTDKSILRDYATETGNKDKDGEFIYDDSYRKRKKYIDWDYVGTQILDPKFKDTAHSKTLIEPVDASAFLLNSMLKDSDKEDFTVREIIADVKAVTSGDYDVGSGGDYADLEAAFNDVANLTDDLTFTCISDFTDTGSAQITESLNGHTFTVTSRPHYGNPKNGFIASFNTNSDYIDLQCEGAGNVVLNNLYLKADTTTANESFIHVENVGTSFDAKVYNILLDGNGDLQDYGIEIADNTPAIEVWNIKIWNCDVTGVYVSAGNASNVYENIACYDIATGFDAGSQGGTYNNNVATSATNSFANIGSATGYNNAADDATCADGNWSTGSNNQTSITEADEFESTTDTDDDFLFLKSDGVCDTGGKAPSIADNTRGIGGNLRPGNDSNYSIGADEYGYVSEGSFDVGDESTAEYLCWHVATSYLAFPLTGNLTLTQTTAVTEYYKSNWSGNYGGYILHFTSNRPHYGNPNNGNLISWDFDDSLFEQEYIAGNGNGTLEASHLIASVIYPNQYRDIFFNLKSVGNAETCKLHDLILLGNNKDGSRGISVQGGSSAWVSRIWNCKFTELDGYSIWIDQHDDSKIENCTFYDMGSYCINCGGNAVEVRNCFCDGNTAFDAIGSATGYNNAADDATCADGNWSTGSNNQTNLTPADELESTNDSSNDFLKVKTNATTIDDGGTAPSITDNTRGIGGNLRPGADSNYSIGADEYGWHSTGSFDVGDDSNAEYVCFYSACQYLQALTGDVTWTQITASTEYYMIEFSSDLGGHEFQITSDTPHYGNPNAGHLITWATGNTLFNFDFNTDNGTININKLIAKCTVDNTSTAGVGIRVGGASQSTTVKISDLILLGNGGLGKRGISVYNSNNYDTELYNIKFSSFNDYTLYVADQVTNVPNVENITIDGDSTTGDGMNLGNDPIIVKNCIIFGCTGADFKNIGSATGSNNASEDATAANGNWSSGSNNNTGITPANEFESTTDTDIVYLKLEDAGVCYNGGTSPSITENDHGIRGNSRGSTSIGADEYTGTTAMYYSVGISTSDLKTGSPTVSISNGTATFSAAQTGDIGVGDIVTYDTDKECYIVGKNSTTEWEVRTATGGYPNGISGETVNSIKRTFNSMNAAIDGSTSGIYTLLGNSHDLTGFQLNIACYADGDDSGQAIMANVWTNESTTEYFQIYTPIDTTNECNNSQRHTGIVNGGGYRMTYQNDGSLKHTIEVVADYTRVIGIYIKVDDGGSLPNQRALNLKGYTNANRYNRIQKNLIHYDNTGNTCDGGIDHNSNSYGDEANPVRIENNIIISTGATRLNIGLRSLDNNASRRSDVHIYNNTIIGADTGIYMDRATSGSQIEAILRNNIVNDNATKGYDLDMTDATYDVDYCLSEDASSDDYGGSNNVINTALTFVDGTGGGSTDFHLASSDGAAINAGVGPSTDANVPTTDIDGETRSDATCDIGADEIIALSSGRFAMMWYPKPLFERRKIQRELRI